MLSRDKDIARLTASFLQTSHIFIFFQVSFRMCLACHCLLSCFLSTWVHCSAGSWNSATKPYFSFPQVNQIRCSSLGSWSYRRCLRICYSIYLPRRSQHLHFRTCLQRIAHSILRQLWSHFLDVERTCEVSSLCCLWCYWQHLRSSIYRWGFIQPYRQPRYQHSLKHSYSFYELAYFPIAAYLYAAP